MIVCPGVTIGDDTVVGAGAVVTRDLPTMVAAGAPAKMLRRISPHDRMPVPRTTEPGHFASLAPPTAPA